MAPLSHSSPYSVFTMPLPQNGERPDLLELLVSIVGIPSMLPMPPNVPPLSAPLTPPIVEPPTVPPIVPPMSLNGVLELNAKLEKALELWRVTQSKHEGRLSKFNTQVRPLRAQYCPPPKIHSNPVQPLRDEKLDDEDLLETEEIETLDERELEEPKDPLELCDPEELVELRDVDTEDPAEPWEEREEEFGQKIGSGVHSNVWAFHWQGPRLRQFCSLHVTKIPHHAH